MSDDGFDERRARKNRTRKVPGDDLTNDANWLMEGVDEFIFAGLDGLTVDFVGPTSIVPDCVNGERNVHVLSPVEGFACVTCRQVPGTELIK